MKKVVLSYSGGADSTSLLYKLLADPEIETVNLVSLNYSQRHKKELQVAKKQVKWLRENSEYSDKIGAHKLLDLDLTQFGNTSVLVSDNEVPDQSENKQSSTIVPFRNTLFTLLIASQAKAVDATDVYLSVVENDIEVYPDCRRAFFDQLQAALRLSGEIPELNIQTPYAFTSKKDIVAEGLELGVRYQDTWTCYRGGEHPCNTCDSCSERLEGFILNGVPDPIYSTPEEWIDAIEGFKTTTWYNPILDQRIERSLEKF